MAEETKERDIGAAADGPGADPAAMAIALSGASRAKADAFLDKQNSLADLQIENLRKLDDYETSHLRWRRFNDQMKGAMQIMLVAIGALIVVAIAAAVWSAANDRGLVVEGFTVPPDLAAQGETGAVVATHVMDRISAMESQTSSFRARSSYQNNWGNDIKVQIPETGISVTEAYRFLVGWLGDQTHISGEVARTAKGYAVTARVGSTGSATVRGPKSRSASGQGGGTHHGCDAALSLRRLAVGRRQTKGWSSANAVAGRERCAGAGAGMGLWRPHDHGA